MKKYKIIENMLTGAILDDYSRSLDLIWFNFIKDQTIFALHIQCFLRIETKEDILSTSNDIYMCVNKEKDFNWEVVGDSKFDKDKEHILSLLKGSKVVSVKFNNKGDVKILFENSISLSIFRDITSNDEVWRFFKYKAGEEHYVQYLEFKKE
ncbi:MAG TPA: hypothetical protein DD733_10620 [Clostridiales bacterium]|nr:hypothetical protein [Eubacteriales bacterium]MDD4429753.1 hypothetical protein [Paludibacter sp.]HBR32521.1 hypothetical protein [Clostridiales bacterium]